MEIRSISSKGDFPSFAYGEKTVKSDGAEQQIPADMGMQRSDRPTLWMRDIFIGVEQKREQIPTVGVKTTRVVEKAKLSPIFHGFPLFYIFTELSDILEHIGTTASPA